MSVFISPGEAAKRFRTLAQEIDRQTVNAIRRGQHAARKLAFAEFAKTGIGRAFDKRKKNGQLRDSTSQARAVIKRERVKKVGTVYIADLRLKGFAALVEAGGQTRPHMIRPKNKPALAWQATSGALAGKWLRFRQPVQHPGSRIPRQPFAAAAARRAGPEFGREVEVGLVKARTAAGLA